MFANYTKVHNEREQHHNDHNLQPQQVYEKSCVPSITEIINEKEGTTITS